MDNTTKKVRQILESDKAYDRLFDALMDKYGVDDVRDMDKETRKDFFSELDALWDESDGSIDKEQAKETFSDEQLDKIMSEAYFRKLGRCGCKNKAINEAKHMFNDVE